MGSLVGKTIGDAVLSLKNRDVEMAQRVIDMDKEIDALDHSIEENCMRLLSLQQPMARDLRLYHLSIKKCLLTLKGWEILPWKLQLFTKMTAKCAPCKAPHRHTEECQRHVSKCWQIP